MTAPDQSIRQQALDISQSFIVQAPAGSGKTELLIQRYLALLATIDEPEEALAITFTRKAVAEMRKRVIEALQQAQQAKPEAEHAALTWQLANNALLRSEERQWNLLGQPARLRIMTIDSLNASLVRSMPWLSGVGADVAMEQNAQALYEEAAWQTLDSRQADRKTQEALQTLLLHLDNNDRRVMKLLCDLLAKRDQWLRYLVPLKSGKGQDTRQQLTQMFEEVIEEQLEDLYTHISPEIGQEMVRLAAIGANQLWSDGNISKGHLACRELTELPDPTFNYVDQWQGLTSLYLTDKGGWRKPGSFNKNVGFPAGHEHKEDILQLHVKLQDNDNLRIKLKEIASLPKIIYGEDQWQMLAALIELLPVAVARLKVVFQQAGCMDFVEQSLAAGQSLKQDDVVTDLALKLDYQLKHILMDEFQDTSHSQFILLKKLLDGWQPDDGRSLFLVGDPMQSIYGFREADVSGFLKVRDHGIGDIHPQPLTLQANFRSTPVLMDWFNNVFPDVLAPEDDQSLGAVSYTEAVSARAAQSDSVVRIHAALDRDQESEARHVVELVAQTRAENPQHSIGILVRSRNHLHAIYNELQAAEIDFQALDILPLATQAVAQDLLSVTRTLLHQHDRIAWLAVLRAPWCGLSLDTLHKLVDGHPYEDLWSLLNDQAILRRLDEEERSRLQNIIKSYDAAMNRAEQLSLRTRIEWLWQALGAAACYADATQDTQIWLNVIDELEASGKVVTISAIQTALEKVYSISGQSSVQLMTIHAAKGLQFDTVILPSLHSGAHNDTKQLFVWHEELGTDYESRLLLAPIHAPGCDDQSFTFVRQREQRRRSYETQRLLYVAMTRARDHLHLFASLKSNKDGDPGNPKSGSFLSLLFSNVSDSFESLTSEVSDVEEAQNNESTSTLKRVPSGWQPPTGECHNIQWQSDDNQVIERERIEFSWAGQAARLVGTLTHQYLNQIGEEGLGPKDGQWNEAAIHALQPAIEANLISAGLPQAELETAVQKVKVALTNVIESDRAQWILGEHQQAKSEFSISGVVKGKIVNRIIDRTFIDEDGTRWIIDYKTSSHEGGNMEGFLDEEQSRYEAQLNEYAQMLQAVGTESIKLGLYFPLMEGWREWSAR